MTGFFVYHPGPAGVGWKWDADARTRASLLPLRNSWLLSENYSPHLTTIGHITHGHDYVVFVHHDRSFAGQLIPTPQYGAANFDPFAIVTALPQATAALRDAVAWGDSLHKSLNLGIAVGTVSFADLNAAFQAAARGDDDAIDGEHTTQRILPSLWQSPANTLAVAIARALFLAEPPERHANNYFSVFPPGLQNASAPLCRFVDTGGAPPPAALLDAALALPDARTKEHSVTLALSVPSKRASGSQKAHVPSPGSAPASVRQFQPLSTYESDTKNPKTPEQKPTDRSPTTPSPARDNGPQPPTAVPPNSHAQTGARKLPWWWLSPAATAAVALLLAVWISSQTAQLAALRDEVAMARDQTEAARVQAVAERDQAEAGRVQAEAERDQAELERVQAEKERDQAELERVQAEAERDQAELERVQAEKERDQAELERVQAELERVQAELERVQAEAERDQAEAERVQAEAERVQVEMVRVRAEIKREEAGTLPSPVSSFGLPPISPFEFWQPLTSPRESDNE
ncbi:hypothetical protein [Roseibium aggregatum]|uniref:hypothetical protein n=1 Tax=Roseibium aggregatum TaxID=187304 RepID=UPI001E65A578|nr:hypothetical protein [Roseibium aggregatum]UFI04653.1 hypothetical protein ST40_005845 [Roseibium aggregatum]